ncbi:hypothetical protein KQY30_00265 [Streptomyces sp. GMY02]|nr:hypothetical protein [Streptomyces sp. GMY02]QXE32960.1 hypothetical protein KQY30_00265 [Streptomyces sp. GMY02]
MVLFIGRQILAVREIHHQYDNYGFAVDIPLSAGLLAGVPCAASRA